jgi:hypothetical protein
MLTPLIPLPVETSLSAISACLDPFVVLEAARGELRRVDEEARARWREARMIEAIYHPSRYLRIVYALVDEPETPATRTWPEGQLVYLHAPVRRPMSRRGEIILIGGYPVEAYCFPNDRRLRGLRTFARKDLAAAAWEAWAEQTGDTARMDESSMQRLLVRYVPEQKWVVRLRAEWSSATGGTPVKRRLAVRSASPASCRTLLSRHHALTQQAASGHSGFTVPAILGGDVDRGLIAFEWLRGNTLVEELRRVDERAVMAAVVRAIRGFHAAEVPALPRVSNAEANDSASDAVTDLETACPDLREPLNEIRRRLPEGLEEEDNGDSVTLHNDLHWNQFSIKGGRFAILDLERMARGDATVDVANFATQLQMLGCRPDIDVDQEAAERWRRTFLTCWEADVGRPLPRARFHALAARSRLELARGMLRHLRPDWPAIVEECVARSVDDVARIDSGEEIL